MCVYECYLWCAELFVQNIDEVTIRVPGAMGRWGIALGDILAVAEDDYTERVDSLVAWAVERQEGADIGDGGWSQDLGNLRSAKVPRLTRAVAHAGKLPTFVLRFVKYRPTMTRSAKELTFSPSDCRQQIPGRACCAEGRLSILLRLNVWVLFC